MIAPWCRTIASGHDLLFGYGGSVATFSGRAVETLLPRLLPLLDGRLTRDEIVEQLGEASRPAVARALALLEDERIVVEGPALEADEAAAHTAYLLASLSGVAPAELARTLAERTIAVVGEGSTAAAVAELCLAGGVRVRSAGFDEAACGELTMVAPSPAQLPLLPDFNERAVRDEAAWLAVLPFDGLVAFVGPMFLPPETSCYECFRLRRAANVPYEAEYRRLDGVPAGYPTPPFVDSILAGFAVGAALRWLAVRDPFLAGATLAIELGQEPSLRRDVVYPVPRCPVCSSISHSAPTNPWADA